MSKRTHRPFRCWTYRGPGVYAWGYIAESCRTDPETGLQQFMDIGKSRRAAVRRLRGWLTASGVQAPGLARKQGKVSSRKDATDG
jgi:hypothetical protein